MVGFPSKKQNFTKISLNERLKKYDPIEELYFFQYIGTDYQREPVTKQILPDSFIDQSSLPLNHRLFFREEV